MSQVGHSRPVQQMAAVQYIPQHPESGHPLPRTAFEHAPMIRRYARQSQSSARESLGRHLVVPLEFSLSLAETGRPAIAGGGAGWVKPYADRRLRSRISGGTRSAAACHQRDDCFRTAVSGHDSRAT
jgi:hypothetical protein